MSVEQRLMEKCRALGCAMPNGVDHEIITNLLTKLIVQEKYNGEDAFELASKSYAEGFEGLEDGGV